MANEVVIIEDKNIKYISLSSGTYKIDGEIVIVESNYSFKNVPVENENDVRLVTINKFIDYYQGGKEDQLSVANYEAQKANLSKVAIPEEYGGLYWGNKIDEEYVYKKFVRIWAPIYNQEQMISEPIEVNIIKIQANVNNNPYIVNMFLEGINQKHYKNQKTFYQYNQESARNFIVSEYMKKLGFTFNKSDRYDIKTEWSNSDHSGIRYAKAFGKYIFGQSWKNNYTPRGSVEEMEKRYNSDKINIEAIIKSAYIEKFGDIDETSYNFGALIRSLKNIRSDVQSLDYKVKERSKKRSMLIAINELIEDIECKLGESVDIGE